MKFVIRLAVLFYVTSLLFVGSFLLLFVMHMIPLENVVMILQFMYYDEKMRLIWGIIAAVLLIKNYIYAQAISGFQQRGRTIAFDNPSGRVTLAVSALEDLVRRVILGAAEVKDVRSYILAGKRGLEVNTRIVLKKDVNIPEMTSELQELVKRKLQDMIGLEETITVRIHVARISAHIRDRRKDQVKDKNFPSDEEPTIPFQGYRP
ncbi:MAG: alkaline shock response membrane anchor protein AmaP [Candidatus Omnitrophica bacterium]|nr:alkaline shock response membrane anchor protein AmaP [Candidatus Omnitrophota bacterium]